MIGRLTPLREWTLWSLPPRARSFLLLVEATAATLTVFLLLTQPVSRDDVLRVVGLGVLAIGYAECAARIERLKRFLGRGKLASNQVSMWTFAAALSVPAGWAALLVVLIYAHSLLQRRRDRVGQPYRIVFTAATVVLSVLAAAGVLSTTGGDVLRGGLLGTAVILGALLVCNLVNFGVLITGMWLTARPPSLRAMLPTTDALGYELAALVLGILTAELLLHAPSLTPLVLVLVVCLRRSSLVAGLNHTARTDAKTGLLNAVAWNDHAAGVVSRTSRDGHAVTVLFCDLDNFKAVNDTHGHLVGDQVLLAVASCLRRELRGHDGLGRYGGEEFVVILDRLDQHAAELVANRLRAAVHDLALDRDLHITISIGLAHHPADDGPADLQQLLARADSALYDAKAAGRDRVQAA